MCVRFYNSRFDLAGHIEADYPADVNTTDERYNTSTPASRRITALASALARYLFWAATGNDPNTTQLAALTVDISDVS